MHFPKTLLCYKPRETDTQKILQHAGLRMKTFLERRISNSESEVYGISRHHSVCCPSGRCGRVHQRIAVRRVRRARVAHVQAQHRDRKHAAENRHPHEALTQLRNVFFKQVGP